MVVWICEGIKIISLNNLISINFYCYYNSYFSDILFERFMKVICNIKFFIYNKEFLILLVCFNKVGKGLCIKMMVVINNRKN